MRVPLFGGSYEARSIIANAQRCVNLYPEKNPEDSPSPYTYYPTPGLTLLATPPTQAAGRGLYATTNGKLYAVVGNTVYNVDSSFVMTVIGTIGTTTNPVSMVDNGLDAVLVDGTLNTGYQINLGTNVMTVISSPGFYGADRVDYMDTYLLFNRPDTKEFYISGSNAVTFDPLDLAAKTGFPDLLQAVIVMQREIWLIGQRTTELWYNSGSADFPFQRMPGSFVEHGCVAKYSVAMQDLSVYWLSQDEQGQRMVLAGTGYQAKRISTHAIEKEFSEYTTVSDAIGHTYQQQGHTFYVLSFPSADKTWVYDVSQGLWHERAWSDSNGNLHRVRGAFHAAVYGKNIVQDWETGKLYELSLSSFTDDGDDVVRIRSGAHLVGGNFNRVSYLSFTADIQVGTDDGSIDGTSASNPPKVSLRWSDTRGATWGSPITQSLGAVGQFATTVTWHRLGMARDRVFELSWSVPAAVALNGAFINVVESET